VDKFLTHRLKGFDKCDYSLDAIQKACKTDIPYIEIDTRISLDKKIFIYHDPFFKNQKNQKIIINQIHSNIIKQHTTLCGHKLLLLDELLEVFSRRVYKKQKLCIDIKDFGFEQQHYDLIKKYNLEDNIIWISWIPQSLIKLNKISPKTPKVLSYIDMSNFNFFQPLLNKISIFKIPFTHFILIGRDKYNHKLNQYQIGFQHAFLSSNLPLDLRDILSKNQGGICIHKTLISNKIINYKKKYNLKLFIFSIYTLKEYIFYKNQSIDVIFVDNLHIKNQLLPPQ